MYSSIIFAKGVFMATENISIVFNVGSPEGDAQDIEDLTISLTDELQVLDGVRSVARLRAATPPAGTKGDPLTGSLLVTLAGSAGISALVTAIGAWLAAGRNRRLKIKIGKNELDVPVDSSLGKPDVQALLDWFKIQSGMSIER
jgi:hypothetical protein